MHERRFNKEIDKLRDPDRVANMERDRIFQLALEGVKDAHTLLDIGTGSGVFAEYFADQGFVVTGLDVNLEMLITARKYIPSGTFSAGVAEHLPYKSGAFDLVFMGLLLHETDDTLAALKEAYRVSVCRLVILEWPGEAQPFGPPLDHRLSYERIVSIAKMAEIKKVELVRLKSRVLYLIDK